MQVQALEKQVPLASNHLLMTRLYALATMHGEAMTALRDGGPQATVAAGANEHDLSLIHI